jgi:hypothetical protein
MAVMSGALEASFLISDNQAVALKVVQFAEPNLSATFNLADYQALWRGCADTERPSGFFPLPDPWGGGTPIDCISRSSSFLRVRVPDQITPTTFGKVLGFTELTTNAAAVAIIRPGTNNSPVVPYGISGAAGSGELCFGSSGSGIALPPCTGPSSGTFGTLLSEFFGDFYGTVDCGNPGAAEISSGTALGIDHFVSVWPNAGGTVTAGQTHPGDTAVNNLPDTNRDECTASGGTAVAVDGVPLNTMTVDSGFAFNPIERGLVSEDMFYGQPSRLQQNGLHPGGSGGIVNTRRNIVTRVGGSELPWSLDNHGPWDYLNGNGPGACSPGNFTIAMDEFAKAAQFNTCLAAYGSSTAVIFDELIAESPRFAWAPQYWYQLPTSGLSLEPVRTFRMVFIAGTWFNCSGTTCDVTFYPDQDQTTDLCVVEGSKCKTLNLSQFSAWVLPDTALPDSVKNTFPGGTTPFQPELFR